MMPESKRSAHVITRDNARLNEWVSALKGISHIFEGAYTSSEGGQFTVRRVVLNTKKINVQTEGDKNKQNLVARPLAGSHLPGLSFYSVL